MAASGGTQTIPACSDSCAIETENTKDEGLRYDIRDEACLAAAACGDRLPVVADGGKKGALTMTNAIGCYGTVSVDYRRDGKPALKLSFGEPGVATVASKPEGWGFYQFPSLSRRVGRRRR